MDVKRIPKDRLASLLVVAALAALPLVACPQGNADDEIARHLDALYSAVAERDLTRAEVREVTELMLHVHAARGRSLQQIREIARSFAAGTKLLQTQPESPAAQAYRDLFLATNYFTPDLQGTTEQRLMTEADPVRVITANNRFMTERDIVALANLHDFAGSNDPPRHRTLTRSQIDAAAAQLNSRIGGDSGKLSLFYTEAATFWAGVRQAWPALNTEQRKQVRRYVSDTSYAVLSEELYARLLGLTPIQAFSRRQHDMTRAMMNLNRPPIWVDQF